MIQQIRAGLLLVVCTACMSEGEPLSIGCDVRRTSIALPAELSESSGLALSRDTPGVLWTHNDSGDGPVVYAVGIGGQLLGSVEIRGAENRDWEDLATGPCDGGSCLYIADTGDNEGREESVDIYRIPEPNPSSLGESARAERFRVRYPQGSRDVEAIFALPSGELYLISKGRREPVEVFRYPLPLRENETVVLERVATLKATAQDEVFQVTGAAASPNGEWVAVRAYRALMIYRTRDLLAGVPEPATLTDLTPVGEAQGEAVALADDGTVVLSSEGAKGVPAMMSILGCMLPG